MLCAGMLLLAILQSSCSLLMQPLCCSCTGAHMCLNPGRQVTVLGPLWLMTVEYVR